MCGRFIQITDPEKIKARIPGLEIGEGVQEKFRQRFNIAPTQDILTALNFPVPRLTYTRWGLIPFWAADRAVGSRMINARAETAASKPSFREPLKKRRCLIFSDGFFEWKREGASKRPYFIRMRDGEPFAFAGLWDSWNDRQTGETVLSSTIITTAANRRLADVHDRMPAILEPGMYGVWLNCLPEPADNLARCIRPYPHDDLEMVEVSGLVNSPGNDFPEVIRPV